jgi:crossover junction endodeoxyribonuclease RuvC
MAVFQYPHGVSFVKTTDIERGGFLRRRLVVTGTKGTVVNVHGIKSVLKAAMAKINREVGELIERYKPNDLAVEAPFYGKNPQVMLKLGRAQGAAIAAALSRDIPVFEYAPRKAKMAITGRGDASKEQVALILQKTLGVEFQSSYLDASDAVAIAMCHSYQLINPLLDKAASTSWEAFVKSHPGRVKK